jgi:YD repeat-containing protein
MPVGQLVREVVYNELNDHISHGYWRFWVESHSPKEWLLEEFLETDEGPISRIELSNGHPLDAVGRQLEQARLYRLLNSHAEQARHRQEYDDNEQRIGRIVALLPSAFLYEYAGEENGCYRLRFHPNPEYSAHSVEARIIHAMSGELWVSATYKRLVRLDGRLNQDVSFGFGILGRLYQGGWFSLQRTQVSSTDWKTERFELHMNGRAILFKIITQEISELRSGFTPVAARLDLVKGAVLLYQIAPERAQVSAASFSADRNSSNP